MKKQLIALFVLCISVPFVHAQKYAPIEDASLLKAYEEAIINYYPGMSAKIDVQSVSHIGSNHVLVSFTDGRNDYQTVLNDRRNDMMIILEYEAIDASEAPKIVIDQMEDKEFEGWDLNRVYEAQKPGSEEFYALELIKDQKKQRVHFDRFGHKMSTPL